MARSYSSAHRSRAADHTRTAILDAAQGLFSQHGYTATTIAAIARAAGVAPNTVYVSVGGKPRLVLALVARGIDDPTIAVTLSQVDRLVDGDSVIEALVDGIRRNYQAVFAVISVMYDAARSEPTIAAAVEQAETYYRTRLEHAALHLESIGHLRSELTVEQATDRMWLLLGLSSWRTLREMGWSWPDSQAWLTDQANFAILRAQEYSE